MTELTEAELLVYQELALLLDKVGRDDAIGGRLHQDTAMRIVAGLRRLSKQGGAA